MNRPAFNPKRFALLLLGTLAFGVAVAILDAQWSISPKLIVTILVFLLVFAAVMVLVPAIKHEHRAIEWQHKHQLELEADLQQLHALLKIAKQENQGAVHQNRADTRPDRGF